MIFNHKYGWVLDNWSGEDLGYYLRITDLKSLLTTYTKRI